MLRHQALFSLVNCKQVVNFIINNSFSNFTLIIVDNLPLIAV